MYLWQYKLIICHVELILLIFYEFDAEVQTICAFQTPRIVNEIDGLCSFFWKTLMSNDVQINANALFANAFDVLILSLLYCQS